MSSDEITRILCPRGRELRVSIVREAGRAPIVEAAIWQREADGLERFRSKVFLPRAESGDLVKALETAERIVAAESPAREAPVAQLGTGNGRNARLLARGRR